MIERCAVRQLADAGVTGLSTLYVPPKGVTPPDAEMMARLEMTP